MALFTFWEAFVGKIIRDIVDFIIIKFYYIVYRLGKWTMQYTTTSWCVGPCTPVSHEEAMVVEAAGVSGFMPTGAVNFKRLQLNVYCIPNRILALRK